MGKPHITNGLNSRMCTFIVYSGKGGGCNGVILALILIKSGDTFEYIAPFIVPYITFPLSVMPDSTSKLNICQEQHPNLTSNQQL